MTEDALFPSYVPRQEERKIRDQVAAVGADKDHQSRAVLLYGSGGIGKTSLIRALTGSAADDAVVWLEPIDIDDPEYWLLSTLEQRVAEQLDPEHTYFGPYLEYLSKLPTFARPRIGHETIVSHLGRIKRVFVDCYREFIESGKTVVMTFDTVEAIRGVYLIYTLTQWMKALPGTLFILSGRPPGPGDTLDPIKSELEDPYQSIPVTTIVLGKFTRRAAAAYLRRSAIAGVLTADEKQALVLLSGGHPLWLAFAIDYVRNRDIPDEAKTDLATIRRDLPYRKKPLEEGRDLQEAFKRRLVTPYRDVDFWHEAVKRLAVVRQSVSQEIWQQLMQDRALPADAGSADQAWEMLKQIPWIRTRANGRYLTLHDAVAEELAHRIIPMHDQDQQWRRDLWKRAAAIYGALVQAPEEALATRRAEVDDQLQRLDERTEPIIGEPPAVEQAAQEAAQESESIAAVADLDKEKRGLDQLRAVALYYQLLSDFAAGAQRFINLFETALRQNDVFLQDRLALEMQRFLPGAVHPYTLDDIVGGAISEFQAWLKSEPGKEPYLRIGLDVAGYLIDNEQPQLAIGVLDGLPEDVGDNGQLSALRLQKANAYMRIPGRVADGLPVLREALIQASRLNSPERQRLGADAYRELGFYYRNSGRWREADEAYEKARDAISEILAGGGSTADHENMASIHTNWAYLKGLTGSYHEGTNLVESAIDVRRRLKLYQQEGMSWSTCGEVYRYERRFLKSWEALAIAERAFQGQRNWSWLGVIYQEQAICLFQATEDRVPLTADRDPIEQCKHLITLALDICRDQNLRSYPSALNRAGRIYGKHKFDDGLRYLKEGTDWARRLSDGWFWFANLIEYAELSYRAWVKTGQSRYRDGIEWCKEDIGQASAEYKFSDLEGRWKLVQGHLGIHDALNRPDPGRPDPGLLAAALENYKTGFVQLTQGYMGSSGTAALAREFKKFSDLFLRLPQDVRAQWQREFRRAWSGRSQCSTLLLARLEQLY